MTVHTVKQLQYIVKQVWLIVVTGAVYMMAVNVQMNHLSLYTHTHTFHGFSLKFHLQCVYILTSD